jgi:hypothetical protein
VRRAALVLAALALTGCETSAEKSAKLERVAKHEAAEAKRRRTLAQQGLSITRESTKVTVAATATLHSSEGTAAVVTLRNLTATALRDVPIQVSVKNVGGATIYTNRTSGLAAALLSVPLVPAHGSTTWIDDQVQATGATSVSARVGEGEAVSAAIPQIAIERTHLVDNETSGFEAEGVLANHSTVSQRELVVYATASRRGKVVAAGRAVIPEAAAGASTRFQVFFIGSPQAAQLKLSAAPSTFG